MTLKPSQIKVLRAIYMATDCSNGVYDYATLHHTQEKVADSMRSLVKSKNGVLSVDGVTVATASLAHTIPFLMPIDETFDVGSDERTSVDDQYYTVPFAFNGTINQLTVKLGPPQLSAAQVQQQKDHLARVGD